MLLQVIYLFQTPERSQKAFIDKLEALKSRIELLKKKCSEYVVLMVYSVVNIIVTRICLENYTNVYCFGVGDRLSVFSWGVFQKKKKRNIYIYIYIVFIKPFIKRYYDFAYMKITFVIKSGAFIVQWYKQLADVWLVLRSIPLQKAIEDFTHKNYF